MEKIKVRSSANAEDVPNFDGAGLHDSFAADTEKRDRPDRTDCRIEQDDDDGDVKRKVKPKSVGCAVKGVYASLWNKRAIEERSFARIDQTTVSRWAWRSSPPTTTSRTSSPTPSSSRGC